MMEQDVLNDYLEQMGYSIRTRMVIVASVRQERSLHDLERRVKQIADAIDGKNQKQASKARGLWNAVWHGFGIIKSEGDKIFKE